MTYVRNFVCFFLTSCHKSDDFFPDKSECHCQSYKILLAFAVMSNCNDISQGALVTHMSISTVGCHNPYEYNISNLSMIWNGNKLYPALENKIRVQNVYFL